MVVYTLVVTWNCADDTTDAELEALTEKVESFADQLESLALDNVPEGATVKVVH